MYCEILLSEWLAVDIDHKHKCNDNCKITFSYFILDSSMNWTVNIM